MGLEQLLAPKYPISTHFIPQRSRKDPHLAPLFYNYLFTIRARNPQSGRPSSSHADSSGRRRSFHSCRFVCLRHRAHRGWGRVHRGMQSASVTSFELRALCDEKSCSENKPRSAGIFRGWRGSDGNPSALIRVIRGKVIPPFLLRPPVKSKSGSVATAPRQDLWVKRPSSRTLL